MNIINLEIQQNLVEEFTPIQELLNQKLTEYNVAEGILFMFVPHEVGCITELGWESGIIEDAKLFLKDVCPKDKYKNHDEPNTPFRYNANEHFMTKLIGKVDWTLFVENGKLLLGKYQDLYYFSPVWENISNQKIFCKLLKFV